MRHPCYTACKYYLLYTCLPCRISLNDIFSLIKRKTKIKTIKLVVYKSKIDEPKGLSKKKKKKKTTKKGCYIEILYLNRLLYMMFGKVWELEKLYIHTQNA